MIYLNYGAKYNDHYDSIFNNIIGTQMCGYENDEIYALVFREKTEDDPESNYWGFLDKNDDYVSLIFPSWVQFSICFPYGIEAEEKAGNGRRVNLTLLKVRSYTQVCEELNDRLTNG